MIAHGQPGPMAEVPEVVPLEPAQILAARLGAVLVQQVQDAHDVVHLPRPLGEVHVRRVQRAARGRLLSQGQSLLVQRASALSFGLVPLLFDVVKRPLQTGVEVTELGRIQEAAGEEGDEAQAAYRHQCGRRRPPPSPLAQPLHRADRPRQYGLARQEATQVLPQEAAEVYRLPGSFSRHFKQIVSTSRGMDALSRRGDTGSSPMTMSTVSIAVAAWNGGRPVTRA